MRWLLTSLILLLVVLGTCNRLYAQKPSSKEMAAKLANPTTAPASMTHNLDFTQFKGDQPGADDQAGFTYLFQPTIPLSSSIPRWTLRPAIPILVNQPVVESDGSWDSKFALGDIGFDLVYGTTFKSGLLLSGGVFGSMPTGSSGLSSNQWTLGPNLLVGIAKKWGLVGVLINHKFKIVGPSDPDVNVTAGGYFITFPLGDGTWQFVSTPTFSINHELEGTKLTLPVGGGVSKTLALGEDIYRVQFQYWYYVSQPDAFGPENTIRLTVTKVVNLGF